MFFNDLACTDKSLANSSRAIGVSSSFDREDSIAVTAAGQLHLRLSQTAYQKLGLAGTQSEEISGIFQACSH